MDDFWYGVFVGVVAMFGAGVLFVCGLMLGETSVKSQYEPELKALRVAVEQYAGHGER